MQRHKSGPESWDGDSFEVDQKVGDKLLKRSGKLGVALGEVWILGGGEGFQNIKQKWNENDIATSNLEKKEEIEVSVVQYVTNGELPKSEEIHQQYVEKWKINSKCSVNIE